ncbi:MAG: hypothetical protein KAU01_00685, partial [Candidatus Cloacimonetes bacterium]|nr:hypothetical protein [Candidatus Cloacimonadota bacterium]
MKTLFFIFGFFILSTFLASGVTFADLIQQEEEGFETQLSTTPSSQRRTLRDIPEGGLLLIPDSAGDRVMAFDPLTGDLYEENFIPSDPTNLSTPIQAALHPDQNSILVSDQIKDGLLQYDFDGNFVGWFAPAGGVNNAILDNVRGWGLKADGNILVTTAGGSNSDAIVEFDTSGNNIGNFIANGAGGLDGPWDILYRPDHNDYLVTASSSGGIHQYDMNGVYLGDFATGFSFTEQITEIESGNILFASFSAPSGVHEFASDGTFIGYYDIVGSLRGVYELPNGNILVTNSDGVYEINRNNIIVSTKISGVNARSINFVEPVSPFPPPTNVAVDEEIGTVYWDPPEMDLTRDLIGYNIYLDGVLIVANILPSPLEYTYQDLIPGQTYIAGVSAVYDDPGESEIIEVEFIYSYVIFAPPENLTATVVNYNEVELAWEPPSGNNRALSGYKVYRDAIEIYEITDPLVLTYLDDEGLNAGDYEYYVTAVYVDPAGESVPSNIEEVTITL